MHTVNDTWLVWQVGGYPPRKKYGSFDLAVSEAYRLADIYRGKPFYILKIEAKIKISKDVSLTETTSEKENNGS